MARISKVKLTKEKEAELFEQMYKIIGRLDKGGAQLFLDELLGTEERIMLAKRLAAIILYIQGTSAYRVWTLLKISPSTADRIRLNYKIGRYTHIEEHLTKNRTEYLKIINFLERVLQAGMPPRGRGRWKRVLKNLNA